MGSAGLKDTALVFFGIGVGIFCERTFLGGSSRKLGVVKPQKKSLSRETPTETNNKEIHFQPRIHFVEKLRKEKEEVTQRYLRLLKEINALKLERDACAAREATVMRENDLAVRAKKAALRATAEAVRAREEARQREHVALCAVQDANHATELAIIDKDFEIRAKDKAIREKHEAVESRKRVESEMKRLIDQHEEKTRCALETVVREKIAAVLARDRALSTIGTLRLLLAEQMTELRNMRNQYSLRSIAMNPPQ